MSATPFPKAQQLARGERRYRRRVASPKQWQAIIAAKGGGCRVTLAFWEDDCYGPIRYHHIVSREDHGDDVAENIAPLCEKHHGLVTGRHIEACRVFVGSLEDAEYAYMVQRGGEDYAERAYGVTYGASGGARS